tara:strand:- start:320 stop:1216 length:897 start_codon:yes stop_codon:yes gene_type:complete
VKRLINFQILFLVFLGKLFIKIFIGHNELIYKLLNRFKLSSHGNMKNVNKIYEIFSYYYKNLILFDIDFNELIKKGDFLEVGPGDSLGLSYVFLKTGFKQAFAIDKENFISNLNKKFLNQLDEKICKEVVFDSQVYKNVKNKSLYDSINYLTFGINSFEKIKDNSLTLIVSNAAFEHIERIQVDQYFYFFRKKLAQDGIFILRIDLKDHLVGDFFNHLIPEKAWESQLFKRGSHYTNRLDINAYKKIIMRNNLELIKVKIEKYKKNSFFDNNYSINFNSVLRGNIVPSSILIIGKKNN